MRWKLLIIASLLAALVGAGACLAAVYFALGAADRLAAPDSLVAATFLLPLAAVTFASIFVYRHTARRRPLQAMLTALVATALTLGALVAGSLLLARRRPPQPVPSPVNINAV